jgi:Na+/melibiose symporter-like transporter
MPKKMRATCFGLLLSSFSVGFAIAPSLALKLTHFQVSICSFMLLIASLIYAIFLLKETLPSEISERAKQIRYARYEPTGWRAIISLPFRELAILNRDNFFRVLACLAFFSGISSSGNQSVLIYYLEEYLAFDDGDVATLFVIAGFLGIAVQAFLLKVLLSLFGDRLVVFIAFMCGAMHNAMYAFASSKSSIFTAVAIGTITGTSFPVVSAMKANNVVSRFGL